MIALLLSALLVMSASLAGVVFAWRGAGRLIEKNLSLLVSFSAGVFAVIAWELAGESVEHSSSLAGGLLWVGVGALIFWLIFKIIPSFHHHHDDAESGACPHTYLDARRIIAGDALHNIGDGMLLAASFAVDLSLGFLAAASVFVHELVQEVSEFFVLRQAGFSSKRAIAVNFSVSSTILVGAAAGFLLIEKFEAVEAILLGISSGAFLVVVLHDLVPHSVRTSRQGSSRVVHAIFFIAGILLMFAINALIGH